MNQGHTKNPLESKQVQHTGHVFWLTGLSGSGKSTVAKGTKKNLSERNVQTIVLDGDVLRAGLNSDLDFSEADRKENNRRTAEVAKLFATNNSVVITALISPYTSSREEAKSIIGAPNFTEVYVNASLQTCETRDVKGLYAKARSGEIAKFTGIDSPYQSPLDASLVLDTEKDSEEASIEKLTSFILDRMGIL